MGWAHSTTKKAVNGREAGAWWVAPWAGEYISTAVRQQ